MARKESVACSLDAHLLLHDSSQARATPYEIHPQCYLKILPTIILASEVLFPLVEANSCFCKKTDNDVRGVNDSIKAPAENSKVVSVRFDRSREVRTVPIIVIDFVEVLDVV